MNSATASVKIAKRVKYGFALDFPAQFTMRQLRNLKGRKVKYITLYMRVQKALKAGQLVVSGVKTPDKARRGAREKIYQRADAKVTSVSTSAPVSA